MTDPERRLVDFSDLPVILQELAFRHWLEGAIGKNIIWKADGTGGGPQAWHCLAGTLHGVEIGDPEEVDG